MSRQFNELVPEEVSPEPITRGLATPPTEAVELYAKRILLLQRILINSQQQLRRISIGMEGIRGRRTVSCLTEFLGPYLNEVATVQAAAIEPSKISSLDSGVTIDEDTEDQIEELREQGNLYRELERLETLRGETMRQVNSMIDTANTRLGLVISVTAVVISVASLIT